MVLGVMMIIGACDSASDRSKPPTFDPIDETAELPSASSERSFCNEGTDVSGGDLMASADRIVVGTVTKVEVVEEVSPPDFRCAPENTAWTLRVTMDVSENLKGEGNTVEFIGFFQYSDWSSRPMHLLDGIWWTWDMGEQQSPKLQMSETLGWTEDAAVQPGQKLLVFLWNNQGLGPQRMPLAKVDAQENVHFQGPDVAGFCLNFPANYADADLTTIRASLADAAIATASATEFSEPTLTTSLCYNWPQPAWMDGDMGFDQ